MNTDSLQIENVMHTRLQGVGVDGLDLRLCLRGVRLLRVRVRLGGQVLGVRHVVCLRLGVRRRRRLQALRLHRRLDRLARLHQACAPRGSCHKLEH
jgi:hypothetical protein